MFVKIKDRIINTDRISYIGITSVGATPWTIFMEGTNVALSTDQVNHLISVIQNAGCCESKYNDTYTGT